MATQATSGGLSLTAWIAGGSVAALLGLGGLYYSGVLAPDPTSPTPQAAVEDAPATGGTTAQTGAPLPDTTTSPDPAPDQSATAKPAPPLDNASTETTPQADAVPPAPDLVAPRFDVVRVDPDGNTVIAGTGTPGARVTIFLDDADQISTVIDRAGAFVSLLSIPPSTAPRVLSMVAELDGAQMPSDDQIILAPTPVADTEIAAGTAIETTPTPDPQVAQAETTAPADEIQLAQVEPDAEAPADLNPTPSRPDTALEPVQQVEEQTTETEPAPTGGPETVIAQAEPAAQPAEPPTQAAAQPEPAQTTPEAQTPAVSVQAQNAAQTAAQTPAEPVKPKAPDVVAGTEPAPDTPMEPAPEDNTGVVAPASSSIVTQQAGETVQTEAVELAPAAPADVTAEAAVPEPVAEPVAEASSQPRSEGVATSSPPTTPQSAASALPEPTQETGVQNTTTATVEPAPETVVAAVESAQTPAPVTVLRAGKDGVEVLQPATPVTGALDKIALDTIGYSETGQVQLSGRARGQSLVRVYLDNAAVADFESDGDGRWSGQIEGIEPGIYTLRLDELGKDGEVLSRMETPFKREAPEVLNPPRAPTVVAQNDTPAPATAPLVRAVTVQRGDTLWAISRERYGEGILYVRVFEANRGDIRDPDLIYPGQVFTIPE